MANRTFFLLAVGISLSIPASGTFAQDEQWLQYHSERKAYQTVGDMGNSMLQPSTTRPEGVDLPEFKNENPLFFQWSSPMVEGGKLWIALDRTRPKGNWDQLFIDSNGDGHLSDETAVTPYRTEQYYSYFGPVKVVFKNDDGPVTYHLDFRFLHYEDRDKRLYIYPGCWYEGQITVGGQTKHCVLIDQNVNGTFNDKSLEAPKSDRIRIGEKDSRDTRYVGNYIEVDGVLYEPEIARDGAYIKLKKAEDLKYGNIRLPETITEFSTGGENVLFNIKTENASAKLPVGKYRINYWEIDRKDEKGREWTLRGMFLGERGDFEITEGTETFLEIGEPVTGALSASSSGDNYEFSKSLRGSLGEYVRLTYTGRDVGSLWKMKAKNKEGTYEKLYPIPDQ